MTVDVAAGRAGRVAIASAAPFLVILVASLAYASGGGGSRDLLVQELLINLVLVLGFHVFIGTTGILSFGHLAFAQIAAYGAAVVAIPVATKATSLPELPLGLADVETGPFVALLAGVAVALGVGAFVGVAVARAGGLAATMITLAVLFVVDQVVKNWTEVTRGAGGLSGVPRLGTDLWLWIAALGALLVANGFHETRAGRFAAATREDEIAAPSIGIGLFAPRYVAWLVSIGVVAVAGALRVQAIGSTNPKQYTLDVGVLLLAMLVVGGMRSVSGAVVGTVLITVGNEIFRQLGDPQRLDVERLPDLFLGVVLLGVMLVRPGGLLGDADLIEWLRRRARRRARRRTARVAQPADLAEAVSTDGAAPKAPPAAVDTLEASGIVVRFGGFVALDGPGISVRPGEIVGLIGPNGAGKTTLFNVLTGLVRAEAGSVQLGDRELLGEPPHRIAQAGLARTFQNLRVFSALTVHENVALAAESAGRTRPRRVGADVDDLLERSGLAGLTDRRASTLDYGNLRRLELARAAAMSPKFLLLDEPTSGMSDDESAAMVDRVRSMAVHVGAGVVVIDHDLAFITRISDHIVVLSEGIVLAEGAPDVVRRDPGVVAAYLGSAADEPPP